VFPDLNNHAVYEGTQLVGTGGEVGDTSTLPKADAYVCMYNNNAYCFLRCNVENEGNNVRNKRGNFLFGVRLGCLFSVSITVFHCQILL
jgi:hypothetical protein